MKFESQSLRELALHFRLADLLDIALIAVLVYGAVLWMRRAHSRFVALGLGTMACLYLVARLLHMYLTLFVFQLGFTVVLIALIVIFQEEIRRGFERIALFGPFVSQRRQSDFVEILVETVVQLATNRSGALIVVKGKEPLDRHLSGGITLEGRLSPSLLHSIFDHHSPGHDGAVIIDRGQASKFCVHLPLSTSDNRDPSFGTRHTAALGLSERSDALVIVVSEERGTISVAERGQLSAVAGGAELRVMLNRFVANVSPQTRARRFSKHLRQNLHLKALAVALATGAWLFVAAQQRESAERTFTVPVLFRNLPDQWLLEEPDPLEARVTLAGPLWALERFKLEDLTLEVDVNGVHRGTQKIPLGKQNLSTPAELSVQNVEPSAVRVTAYPKASIALPVKPRFRGQLPSGLKLQSYQTEPVTVRLLVREADREKFDYLSTDTVPLANVTRSTTVNAHIALPDGTRLADGEPYKVQIKLELSEAKRP